MANSSHDDAAIHGRTVAFAAGLLALFAARHLGYYLFDGADRAHAWNISGAVLGLILAALAVMAVPTRVVVLICAWAAFEELQVILCSAAWIIRPWTVLPGRDQCSALVGVDLGALGLMAIMFLLFRLPVRSDSDEE